MNVPQVAERLRHVYDPNLGLDIVALGLVYGITARPGHVAVQLTATSRGCPFSGVILETVRAALRAADDSREVEVDLTWEPPWNPCMIEPAGRAALGLR